VVLRCVVCVRKTCGKAASKNFVVLRESVLADTTTAQFDMRAPIVGMLLVAVICAFAVASCDLETTEDFIFDDELYGAEQVPTCFEHTHYPLGFRTVVHDDFCHGFGRLQATYDRYHFSYVDAIDDATTLPMERLALGEGRQRGGRADVADSGVPVGSSDASRSGLP
jgi:hypothetical protein